MRVEAIKKENGVWLPMLEMFEKIHREKIWLDIEILDVEEPQSDEYAALDNLIGLCETNRTDASIQHDVIIYAAKENLV